MGLKDYKLESVENGYDIVLKTNGDFDFVTDNDATVQRLEQKLRLWKGEYFLARESGVPYFQDILGQKPTPAILSTIFRTVINSDTYVQSIDDLTLEFEDTNRLVTVSFEATLIDATQISVEVVI